ncbi:nucleotidyltransferase [Clostridium rectalis]|uniref:nucleotidyltransferase n=1 Tax=Clostridium rectalis TaxID=2040295 RepID=UPI000F632FD8|nr:nucleotidyltransferase [Clostridium rectalis]
MKVTGIIAEYNPFHKGHLYHVTNTKKICASEAVIVIMSGNFAQRGIPTLVDKWTRAQMALLNGVDLVIELPTVYSLSSAEFFAFGAISLLNNLGIVDNICFGSESGDINELNEIAKILIEEPMEYKESLKKYLKEGYTYPSARSAALKEYSLNKTKYCLHFNNVLCQSNNILGIEYIKNLFKLNSKIKSFTIKRCGSSYNSKSLEEEFSSATSIRHSLKTDSSIKKIEKYIPENILNMLLNLKNNNYKFVFQDNMFKYIKYKYLSGIKTIENLPDVSEGLHNRIYKNLLYCNSLDELTKAIKTKRYTYTRISRLLCQYFLNFDIYDTFTLRQMPCPYARILGFNKKGSNLLKEMKKKSSIPIYTKLPKDVSSTLNLDIQSTKCYSLLNKSIDPLSDFKQKPIILK